MSMPTLSDIYIFNGIFQNSPFQNKFQLNIYFFKVMDNFSIIYAAAV